MKIANNPQRKPACFRRGILTLAVMFLILSATAAFGESVADHAVALSTTIQRDPPTIRIRWPASPDATQYVVFRKLSTAVAWESGAVLDAAQTEYVDTTARVEASYEYGIVKSAPGYRGYGFIAAGIDLPLIEDRGKVVLIVEKSIATELPAELALLEQDLAGDGWVVMRHEVARSDSPKKVKALIVADFDSDPTHVRSVFLLGHVPVPYSGNLSPDGHADHLGAWPADAYYGDMDGEWTDATVNNSAAADVRNWNVPGDGKFDQSAIPSDIELEVGRVDLAGLPSFPQSEVELLRRYLEKDHRFRHRLFTEESAGLISDGFGLAGGEAFAANAWANFTSLIGPGNVVEGQWFPTLSTNGRLWAFADGEGTYSSLGGNIDMSRFASFKCGAVFTTMFGSYLGDWDHPDALLRGPLAAAGSGLACVWAGRPFWYLHQMGLGRTIGNSTLVTQNNLELYPSNLNGRGVHIALMGDPSLRMQYVEPPSAFQAQKQVADRVFLSWVAPAGSVDGYHVYRATSPAGPFQRLNNGLLADPTYTDNDSLSDAVYMVRSVKREHGNGGTYFNASQGLFTELVPPTVTLSATVPSASGIASVVFSRTGIITAALPVAYRLAGSGVNGVDYEPLAGEVTIPAGCTFAKVEVRSKGRAGLRAKRSVKILLMPGSTYRAGNPASAKVILAGDGSAVRPFPLTYTGLIPPGSVAGDGPGRIVVKLGRSGSFSAVIRVGGKMFRLVGMLDADGKFSASISGHAGWKLDLALDLTSSSGVLTGSLGRDTFPASEFFIRPGLIPSTVYAASGYYTAALSPTGGVGSPEGAGWVLVKVDRHGHGRLVGLLGDGTLLSLGITLDTQHRFPLFAPLYEGRGWIAGDVGFPGNADDTAVAGQLDWFKPAIPAAPVYPNGFSAQVSLVGSRYLLSDSRGSAWKLPELAGNVRWSAEGGGLSHPLSELITLDRSGVATVLSPATHGLSVDVENASGLIGGSFIHPDLGRSVRFHAVTLQKENRAIGAFSAEGRTGLIVFERNTDLPGANVGGRNGDDIRPTIDFLYPSPSIRIDEIQTQPSLYVFGTANDSEGLALVQYQTLHRGTLSPLGTANGGGSWSFPLFLLPGDFGEHTVFVRAIDVNGNESDLISRTFTYVVMRDLTVVVNGAGSVTPDFLGTTPREMGESYSIEATPAPGHRFTGWSGSVISTANRITFTMAEGFRIKANFAEQ